MTSYWLNYSHPAIGRRMHDTNYDTNDSKILGYFGLFFILFNFTNFFRAQIPRYQRSQKLKVVLTREWQNETCVHMYMKLARELRWDSSYKDAIFGPFPIWRMCDNLRNVERPIQYKKNSHGPWKRSFHWQESRIVWPSDLSARCPPLNGCFSLGRSTGTTLIQNPTKAISFFEKQRLTYRRFLLHKAPFFFGEL